MSCYKCCRVRGALAHQLHASYVKNSAFLAISRQDGQAAEFPAQGGASCIDNADQRMTADLVAWAAKLDSVLPHVSAAPFKAAFYSWWACSYTGWQPVLLVYACFIMGALLQR